MKIQGVHKKSVQFVFWQYLPQIFTKFKKEGQFWNLLVLRISKLSLIFDFRLVEAEILGLEQTRGHFQFLQFLQEFIQI